GRGTDIELDIAARAAGGLHVLSCQDNPSRRLDRQLAGRAGRHGNPGSAETWLLRRHSGSEPDQDADTDLTWIPHDSIAAAWLMFSARRLAQTREERRRAALRRELLRQDRHWQRRLAFSGPPA
ncbi:MAG: preprotein translocase subunit SecA, partial [Rubrivivax sp.]